MVGLTPSPGPLTPADLGWSAMDDSVRAPLDVAALRDGLVGPGMPWRELAVVAWTSYRAGAAAQDVYVPVTIAANAGAGEPRRLNQNDHHKIRGTGPLLPCPNS